MILAVLAALLVVSALPAAAAGEAAVERHGARLLPEDGREVVLAGILLPGDDGVAADGLAAQAGVTLDALLLGGVRLAAPAHDRHGRLLGRIETSDGLWVQGAMVEAGLARVAPRPELDDDLAPLLALEDEARRAGRGLWADPGHRIRGPHELDGLEGTFQLVEGRVHRASPQRRYLYLDMGPDWRRDFSVRLRRGDARRLLPLPAEDMVGRTLRVRGWLFRYFGPGIEVTSRTQIELLD
jgi:micrococcal nuclease